MLKKLIEKVFGPFCKCLEVSSVINVNPISEGHCDEHPKFKHRCEKCQQAVQGV